MPVGKEKEQALLKEMARLDVREEDCVEKFVCGSGKGGQKVNKTASCVYLKHLPTGIEIKCHETRSRDVNRYKARRLLCEKMDHLVHGAESARCQRAAKIKKQKQKRKKRARAKVEGANVAPGDKNAEKSA